MEAESLKLKAESFLEERIANALLLSKFRNQDFLKESAKTQKAWQKPGRNSNFFGKVENLASLL